ncbi:11819_t:CDS:2, partial [Funneliformis geosporum]
GFSEEVLPTGYHTSYSQNQDTFVIEINIQICLQMERFYPDRWAF